MINGDVLVDDDPEELRFTLTSRKKAVPVKSFVSPGTAPGKGELENVYNEINKKPLFGFLKG